MDMDLNSALIRAVQSGDEEKVRALLEQGVDPNAEWSDEVAFRCAGSPPGAKINCTPVLFMAIIRGTTMTKLLLDAGARFQPSEGETSPLTAAASAGRTALVREFLKLGLDVNHVERRGITALIAATIEGHWDVLEVLLEAGADPTLKDWQGRTALDWARLTKRRKVLEVVERGAR